MSDIIRDVVEKKYMSGSKSFPLMRIGDTVRVYVKIIEGDSERLQPFEGTLIRRKGSGINTNITVRKISYGIGVERIFPLFSPYIDKLEVLRSAKVRRAKLYYLRKLSGRAARMTSSEEATAESPNTSETANAAEKTSVISNRQGD